ASPAPATLAPASSASRSQGSARPLPADPSRRNGPSPARRAEPGRAGREAPPAPGPGRATAHDPTPRDTEPAVKGGTKGFMLEYSPAGFGYQTQKCIVNSFGCQKKNAAPVPGAVVGQSAWLGSGTNVPST